MKNNFKITQFICVMLLATGITCYVSSCKKDSSSNSTTTAPTTSVTEADAAELTSDAVIPSTGGMVTQNTNSVGIYKSAALGCGIQKDSTIVKASASGATPTYDYNLSWNYTLNCTGIVPSQLTFSFTGTGDYDGPNMSSSDKSTGGFVLTGLQASASQYLLNATYSRNGTTTSKIGKQNTFTSTITITSTNIAVDKTTEEIASGTAAVTITATSTSGKTFNFAGTITFLGNKKGTLVLNSGISYAIQWS